MLYGELYLLHQCIGLTEFIFPIKVVISIEFTATGLSKYSLCHILLLSLLVHLPTFTRFFKTHENDRQLAAQLRRATHNWQHNTISLHVKRRISWRGLRIKRYHIQTDFLHPHTQQPTTPSTRGTQFYQQSRIRNRSLQVTVYSRI